MPELSAISYSQDATVAAVNDYYSFLTRMYLPESAIIEPPEGGWPSITTEAMQDLGKTDVVVSLLRHLPYIRSPSDDRDIAQGAPWCTFADWRSHSLDLDQGHLTGEDLRDTTQGFVSDDVPAHVVGLTSGGRDNPLFLLDTELGTVHWPECPGEIRYSPSREKISDDAYDYAPENEAEWRGDAPAWAIPDFFELLKDQFRELKFVPVSPRAVFDVHARFGASAAGLVPMVQGIFREHGWPDLERYRKRDCLAAVEAALEERYPAYAERRGDE